MAGKKSKLDTTRIRAEKLFKAGKFLLAEKEFEKIEKRVNSRKITEKLNICRKETRVTKGENFVKQGQESISSNKPAEAIACFQEAEKLLNEPWLTEPWITDKIKELQRTLARHKMEAKARKAETSHDYLKASDLYTKAGNLLKSALCLVKAENYGQAVAVFQKSDILDDPARYYYGFALAKTGQYHDALKQWEKLDTHDKAFVEQKRRVLSLAAEALARTIGKKEDSTAVHNTATDLLGLADTLGNTDLIDRLETICFYCKLVLIETLWKQEAFSAIADLLLQMTAFNDPILLALNAKTYFHLSREQSRFLEPMTTFWLTTLYSKEISAEFSDDPDKRQKVQLQLIRIAEQYINCQQDVKSAGHAAGYLAIEKKLLKDLSVISRKHAPVFHQICTPRYASICGLSDTILGLIRQHKDYFKDPEHYLETGGYYSRTGEGLYALRTHGAGKALALIEAIESTAPKDEFTDYVLGLVQFEFGLAAMENYEKEYLQYFALTSNLFKSAPSIEKRFSDKILQYEGDQLVAYEKLLMFLHKQRRSDAIAEALSFVMTQSAIIKLNHGKIAGRQIKIFLEKALKIYPQNELALHTLERTLIDQETGAILNAMGKNKLGKAARLARQSTYPEVGDRYFEFGEQMFEQIGSSGLDLNFQKINLLDLLKNSVTVDPDHPLIGLILSKLQFLGDE